MLRDLYLFYRDLDAGMAPTVLCTRYLFLLLLSHRIHYMYWLMNAKLPGICVSVFTTASLSDGLSFPAPVRMTSCLCWQSGLVQPTGKFTGSFVCTVSRMHTTFIGALILAWICLFAPTNGSSSGISSLKPPYLPLPPSRPLPLPPHPPPRVHSYRWMLGGISF